MVLLIASRDRKQREKESSWCIGSYFSVGLTRSLVIFVGSARPPGIRNGNGDPKKRLLTAQ
jgi:hypothetical protein